MKKALRQLFACFLALFCFYESAVSKQGTNIEHEYSASRIVDNDPVYITSQVIFRAPQKTIDMAPVLIVFDYETD
jgi:hypothetical protein